MENPNVISLPEWEWTKIATNVIMGTIHRLSTTVYYYQTYRKTGEAAPTAPTIGTIPNEAVKIFEQKSEEDIGAPAAADVYIMTMNNDEDNDDDSGKIRVDV